jgi:hypothetical protein
MPYQGTVLVAAIPSFTRGSAVMSSESLIYTWREGDEIVGDSSGKGKNLFVFRGEVPMRVKTVSVVVESPDHTMFAEALINVVPVAPRLLFYEEHPLYGILPRALVKNFLLKGDEVRIGATPYYFETAARSSAQVLYDWQVNYEPVTSERGNALTLRRATDAAGKSNLFLEAKNADENRYFQAAEERLTIEFPEKTAFVR